MALTFSVFDILSNTERGELEPKSFKFNAPVFGSGSCTMDIAIRDAAALRRRTEPDQTQLVIRAENGEYLWDGPIVYRKHKPGQPTITVQASQWKSWLYDRLYMTKIQKTNYDQWQMAYDIVDYADSDKGCPVIQHVQTQSGVNRDFTIQPQWSCGQALDSFGKRDGGFEWELRSRESNLGKPELWLVLWQIGQERSLRPTLSLDSKSTRNNITVGDVPEDATELRTRVWALGEGQYPDQEFVPDETAELATGRILLRETSSTWSGVTQRATLFDHARAERLAREFGTSTLAVDHPADDPALTDYEPGDRARLIIKDSWMEKDISGIRIIDRVVEKKIGQPLMATAILDLTDVRDLAV